MKKIILRLLCICGLLGFFVGQAATLSDELYKVKVADFRFDKLSDIDSTYNQVEYTFSIVNDSLHCHASEVNDSVDIKFDIYINNLGIKSNHRMTLRPFLRGVNDSLCLPDVVAFGQNWLKSEEQRWILAGKKYDTCGNRIIPQSRYLLDNNIYTVINESDSVIHYALRIPHRPFMDEGCVFILAQVYEGCCNISNVRAEFITLSKRKKVERLQRNYNPIYSSVNSTKNWEFSEEGDLTIFFKVDKEEINDTIFSNQVILKCIASAVNSIRKDENSSFNKVEILGYASPEGTLERNQALGYGRAIALRNYVKEHLLDCTDDDFKINQGAENWDGLKDMVTASNMQYREDVLDLMNNITPDNGLKEQLKNLHKGVPWQYMLQNFFPKLRTAIFVSVSYSLVNDKVAEDANRAVKFMEKGEYTSALGLLLWHKNDSRTYNLIGVCYMMTDRDNLAKTWLRKAMESGCEEAKRNILQIQQ